MIIEFSLLMLFNILQQTLNAIQLEDSNVPITSALLNTNCVMALTTVAMVLTKTI